MTPEEQKAYLEKCISSLEKKEERTKKWNKEHRESGRKAVKKYQLSHPDIVKRHRGKTAAKRYRKGYLAPWMKS